MQRTLALTSAVLLALALVACAAEPDPANDATLNLYLLTIKTTEGAAAAEISIRYDTDALDYTGMSPNHDSMLAKAYNDSATGRLKVAFVSTPLVTGDLIEVAFHQRSAVVAQVDFDARAYDEAGNLLATPINAEDRQWTPAAHNAAAYDPMLRAQELNRLLSVQDADTLDEPTLDLSFADHLLGDLNRDNEIDVRDVLRALQIAIGTGAEPTDYELYHSDLLGNGTVDILDVLKLLHKAVDPTLPAQLHLAPRPMKFAHVHSNQPVLIGNAGNKPLPAISVSASADMQLAQVDNAGIVGQSAAYEITVAPSWRYGSAVFDAGAAGRVSLPVGNITLLIAGQSNASGHGRPMDNPEPGMKQVRMFGNDYVWKQAYEPLDEPEGQVDSVSESNPVYHSFGVKLGKELFAATGHYVYLIPSARNGSRVAHWLPDSDPLNRGSLFGSANYRSQTSAGNIENAYPAKGGPVAAIVWFQGETDRYGAYRPYFISNTNTVMDAFAEELARPPVIYVQLAANQNRSTNENQQVIREFQRLMETDARVATGAGPPQPRQDFHMVVAHDLPLSDSVHVSAEGQRLLGERLALAFRQHALGEPINGTGPRLVGITQPTDTTVKVKTTRAINDHSDYDNYFTVRETITDDEGSTAKDIAIVSMGRDPSDETAVLLTLERAPQGVVTVRYMPPPARELHTRAANVVQDADGLPLPAFGTHGVK